VASMGRELRFFQYGTPSPSPVGLWKPSRSQRKHGGDSRWVASGADAVKCAALLRRSNRDANRE